MKKLENIFFILLFILSSCVSESEDELHLNYLHAIDKGYYSSFNNFIVIEVKNLNNDVVKKICTKSNFLEGAIHMEHKIEYDEESIKTVTEILKKNKKRYFEFKNQDALYNIGFENYSQQDIDNFEKTINIDSISTIAKNTKEWGIPISDNNEMLMYAHSLFQRGVLTGENSCFGGTLYITDRNKKRFTPK